MPVKNYKSMTNGQRGMSTLINDVITKATPEKSLVITLKKNGGRNNQGKITLRHRGGGAKRKYRIIDFKRLKDGIVGTVSSIEYDPLVNVDFTETFERSANTDNTGNANSSGLGVASDTPQGKITKSAILQGNYASSTSASENETTSSSSSDETESYVKRTKGNSGISATAQAMVKQYRDNIRAIDREIIDKLEPLFMGLY